MTSRRRPDWVDLSSPGHNRPLVPRVARLAGGLRVAVAQVEAAIDVPFEALYQPTRKGLGFTIAAEDRPRRSAWALVGEWLVAASAQSPSAHAGLQAAHEWFWSGSGQPVGAVPDVPMTLVDVVGATELRALMPYILDPMAAATRREVLGALSTVQERHVRKVSGVFYTPGDVAHLMVERLMAAGQTSSQHLWFDPAHGSGVFLRAVLSAISDGGAEARRRIYGVDVNPLAAETSAFVLTAEDLIVNPDGPAPWERWHEFRRNLATGDALLINALHVSEQPMLTADADRRPLDSYPLGQHEPWGLQTAFPETAETGFARIIVNPPYAPLQPSLAATNVPVLHPVTGTSANRDVSPVFVELCANLLSLDGAMAAVTPLSVVSSTRAPFPELRRHLAGMPGSLELLSFDRVPDALFGDDIKTRNAIVHLDMSAPSRLSASPLFRWTSRSRESALGSVPCVTIDGLRDVPDSIPKIGSEWERQLFVACTAQARVLDSWITHRRTSPLTSVTPSSAGSSCDLIALAPTAYNFLGVIRDPYRAVTEGHNSQNGYAILTFASEKHASAAYAVLSSRVAFWLWHVTGDGFHVTGSLCRRMPVPADVSARNLDRLADLGDRLWKCALQDPLVSSNRGRTTVAYPAWAHADLTDEIDAAVGSLIGLECAERLSDWHERLVVVDVDSERRNLIRRNRQ